MPLYSLDELMALEEEDRSQAGRVETAAPERLYDLDALRRLEEAQARRKERRREFFEGLGEWAEAPFRTKAELREPPPPGPSARTFKEAGWPIFEAPPIEGGPAPERLAKREKPPEGFGAEFVPGLGGLDILPSPEEAAPPVPAPPKPPTAEQRLALGLIAAPPGAPIVGLAEQAVRLFQPQLPSLERAKRERDEYMTRYWNRGNPDKLTPSEYMAGVDERERQIAQVAKIQKMQTSPLWKKMGSRLGLGLARQVAGLVDLFGGMEREKRRWVDEAGRQLDLDEAFGLMAPRPKITAAGKPALGQTIALGAADFASAMPAFVGIAGWVGKIKHVPKIFGTIAAFVGHGALSSKEGQTAEGVIKNAAWGTVFHAIGLAKIPGIGKKAPAKIANETLRTSALGSLGWTMVSLDMGQSPDSREFWTPSPEKIAHTILLPAFHLWGVGSKARMMRRMKGRQVQLFADALGLDNIKEARKAVSDAFEVLGERTPQQQQRALRAVIEYNLSLENGVAEALARTRAFVQERGRGARKALVDMITTLDPNISRKNADRIVVDVARLDEFSRADRVQILRVILNMVGDGVDVHKAFAEAQKPYTFKPAFAETQKPYTIKPWHATEAMRPGEFLFWEDIWRSAATKPWSRTEALRSSHVIAPEDITTEKRIQRRPSGVTREQLRTRAGWEAGMAFPPEEGPPGARPGIRLASEAAAIERARLQAEVLPEARRIVAEERTVSPTVLRRRMGLSREVAERAIWELEQEGTISAPDAEGRRRVLRGGPVALRPKAGPLAVPEERLPAARAEESTQLLGELRGRIREQFAEAGAAERDLDDITDTAVGYIEAFSAGNPDYLRGLQIKVMGEALPATERGLAVEGKRAGVVTGAWNVDAIAGVRTIRMAKGRAANKLLRTFAEEATHDGLEMLLPDAEVTAMTEAYRGDTRFLDRIKRLGRKATESDRQQIRAELAAEDLFRYMTRETLPERLRGVQGVFNKLREALLYTIQRLKARGEKLHPAVEKIYEKFLAGDYGRQFSSSVLQERFLRAERMLRGERALTPEQLEAGQRMEAARARAEAEGEIRPVTARPERPLPEGVERPEPPEAAPERAEAPKEAPRPEVGEKEAPEVSAGRKGEFLPAEDHPVQYADPKTIEVSQADVPNFKKGADPETGIVEPLKGPFDYRGVGPIIVWERLDGRRVVATGRHRLDLAKREKVPVPVQVIREADGWTQDRVMILDAELNIRDNQGTVEDYAHYFQNSKITEEDARSRGLLRDAKGYSGFHLGRNATDLLRDRWLADEITERKAVAIAEAAPQNEAVQAAVVDALDRNPRMSPEAVGALSRRLTRVRPTRPTGEVQEDIFGFDESLMRDLVAESRAAGAILKDKRVALGTVKRAKAMADRAEAKRILAEAGIKVDIRSPKKIEDLIERLTREVAEWEHYETRPELVAQARKRAGLKAEAPPEAAAPQTARPLSEIADRWSPTEWPPDAEAEADRLELEAEAPPAPRPMPVPEERPPAIEKPAPPVEEAPAAPARPKMPDWAEKGQRVRFAEPPVAGEPGRTFDGQIIAVRPDSITVRFDDGQAMEFSAADLGRAPLAPIRKAAPKPKAPPPEEPPPTAKPPAPAEEAPPKPTRGQELGRLMARGAGRVRKGEPTIDELRWAREVVARPSPDIGDLANALDIFKRAGVELKPDKAGKVRLTADQAEFIGGEMQRRALSKLKRLGWTDDQIAEHLKTDDAISKAAREGRKPPAAPKKVAPEERPGVEPVTEVVERAEEEAPAGRARAEHRGAVSRVSGGSRPADRAGKLVVARAEHTQEIDLSKTPERARRVLDDPKIGPQLSEHQRDGVGRAIQSLEDRGGFLFADGTGAGKTRQLLAVAEAYRGDPANPRPVLIVAPAEVLKPNWDKGTVSGSYAQDSKAMGVKWRLARKGFVEPGEVVLTTYHYLKEMRPKAGTVLIFDESHALKNAGSARHREGMNLINQADKVVFASATPADKATHIMYLERMGILEGKTVREQLEDLGMILEEIEVKTKRGKIKKSVWAVNPRVGTKEVFSRLSDLFDRMTERGAMVKREISWDGVPIEIERVSLPRDAFDVMQRIEEGFAPGGLETAQGLFKARILMHQRRQQEPYKIARAVELAKREVEAGRQVVIFAHRVNYSEAARTQKIYGFTGEVVDQIKTVFAASEGTAPALKKALAEAGITDVAEMHGGVKGGKRGMARAMAEFQRGDARVLIATTEAGGVGVNLDDITGKRPRTMIIMTPPFSAMDNVQAAGRVWRMSTKSKPRVIYLFANTEVDAWNSAIIASKMEMLGAAVKGEIDRLRVSPEEVEYAGPADFEARGGAETTETELLRAPAPKGPGKVTAKPRIAPAPIPGKKPKKLGQIVLDLSRRIGHTIHWGRPGGRRTLEAYRPGSAAIIARFPNDLDSTAHGIAHWLDDRFALGKEWHKPHERSPFDDELVPHFSQYGTKAKSLRLRRAEGIAEYIRAWILNPDVAEAQAPKFTDYFKSRVPADMQEALQEFGRDVRTFVGANAHEMIMANIADRPPGRWARMATRWFGSREGFATFGDRIMERTDRSWMLKQAIERARQILGVAGFDQPARPGQRRVRSREDPMLWMRLLNGATERMDMVFEKGVPSGMDPTRLRTKHFDWIMEPLDTTTRESLRRDTEQMITYMVAERTVEKAAQLEKERVSGIGGGIFEDVAVAERRLREIRSDPALHKRVRTAAGRYRKWADSLLRFMVETDMLSQEQLDLIRKDNAHYVAMLRVMESEPGQEIVVMKRSGRTIIPQMPIHQMKGSARMIRDPMLTLRELTDRIIREGYKNKFWTAFRGMLLQHRGLHEGAARDLQEIGYRTTVGDVNAIRIFVDGKPEYWRFNEDLTHAIRGLGQAAFRMPTPALQTMWRAITFFPRTLRAGVTWMPPFWGMNSTRDASRRSVISDFGGGPWLSLAALRKMKRYTDLMKQLGAGGAGYYMRSEIDYYRMQEKAIRKLAKDSSTIMAVGDKIGDRLLRMREGSEYASRVAEFKQAYRHAKEKFGYDDLDAYLFAAYKARDLHDMAVAGDVTSFIGQLVPFSNAAVQGFKRDLRAFGTNPGRVLMKWGTFVMAPSLIEYAWNAFSGTLDEWRQQPSYRRYLFWSFKIGDNLWLRIPKPFEIGALASGVIHGIDYAAGNKKAFEGSMGVFAKSVLPYDVETLGGPFSSIINALSNWDPFRGRHIIPPSEEGVELKGRRTGRASRLGKAVQKALGIDARKVDYLARDMFGYAGKWATILSDVGRVQEGKGPSLVMTGFAAEAPGWASRDVQWVLKAVKRRKLGSNPLEPYLDRYFEARSAAERERRAQELRKRASEIRRQWEEAGLPPLPPMPER